MDICVKPAVLITGAGTRLGSHFATHMAQQGYDLALHCNRSKAPAEALSQKLQDQYGVDASVFELDFSTDFDADEFVNSVMARFPNLTCLINNASAYDAAPIGDTPRQLLETQFKVNFFAPFMLCGSFSKQVKRGCVVNILDNKIAFQQHQYSAYLLSKKSLAEFTKMAALEFAPDIRVNGISPGVTLPGVTRDDDYVAWRIDGIPLKKQGSESHLMAALDYLVNTDFVTGQVLFVDGGESVNVVGRNFEDYEGHKK